MESGQHLKAAPEFERIASTSKDINEVRAASWQAAQLYDEAGETRSAIKSYRQYVERFPEPFPQAMETRQKLVVLYGNIRDVREQRYWQTRIIEADRNAGSERTERSKYLASMASLALAGDEYQKYRAIALVEPLQQNLRKKKEQLQIAVDAYTRAAAYQMADTLTNAVFHIAEIYRQFGRALMDSDRPADLNEEELEQYDILLEEQAYPFEEKAIEFHQSNIMRTTENLYDEWIAKSYSALAELYPGRYARSEKLEAYVENLE